MPAVDGIPASRFRMRWPFRVLAGLIAVGCLVGGGFAAFDVFVAPGPEGSSKLELILVALAMLPTSYVFLRLAWTGSGRFVARFIDVDTLRWDAQREQKERAQLWERAVTDLSAAEELHQRLCADLEAAAEIPRLDGKSDQFRVLGLRDDNTQRQLVELERTIRRLRGS